MNKMVMLAGIPEFEYWSKVKDILKEAAQKLGVTDRTMNNLEKRGELIPTRIGAKVMYKESDITQYLNRKSR